MNNYEEQILCTRIVKLDSYIKELECELRSRHDVVTERDKTKSRMTNRLAYLNSTKKNQTAVLNDLIRKHDEISRNYNTEREQLMYAQEENDRLLFENRQLCSKLEDRKFTIDVLEEDRSMLLEDTEKLQREFLNVTDITKRLKDSQQRVESELRVKEQDIICKQQKLAEKITRNIEMDKTVIFDKNRKESLQASMCVLKKENDRIVRSLQSDSIKLQDRLNEKSAELTVIRQTVEDKRMEVKMHRDGTMKSKKAIRDLRETYYKNKSKTEKEACELRNQITEMSSDLGSVERKLCDVQVENTKLRCQLRCLEDEIFRLESTNERLEMEMKKCVDVKERTFKTVKEEREQYERENRNSEKLKHMVDKQVERIKQLKRKMFEKTCAPASASTTVRECEPEKCSPAPVTRCDSNECFDDDETRKTDSGCKSEKDEPKAAVIRVGPETCFDGETRKNDSGCKSEKDATAAAVTQCDSGECFNVSSSGDDEPREFDSSCFAVEKKCAAE